MANRNGLVLRERMTALVGIALLLGLVGLSYYYSLHFQLAGLKYVPSPKSPDFIAKDIVVTDFNQDGSLMRRLFATEAQHYSDGQMHTRDAQFQSYKANRSPVFIHSDKAWTKDSFETIELEGNVTAYQPAYGKNPELHFKTDYLKGFLDVDFFETEKPVQMRRGRDTTEASNGMEYDNVRHTIELKGNVISVFHPNEDKR